MTPSQDENDWVARLSDEGPRRDAAIQELRSIILRGLSRSLNNKYGCPFDAEDVVQEALVKILSSLEQFQGRSRFTTWAMTVATRFGISALRRKHCRDVSLDSFQTGDPLAIDVADSQLASAGEEMLDQTAILKRLSDVIESSLTDRQKLAIRGSLEGLPVEEIARRTGSNRNAVYKLIHDARLKLRKGLEQAGVVAEDIQRAFP